LLLAPLSAFDHGSVMPSVIGIDLLISSWRQGRTIRLDGFLLPSDKAFFASLGE
jgi:hypothetical protein